MKSRSTKYFAAAKNSHLKKGSANKGGYNEQNETTIKKPNENPAPKVSKDKNQPKKEKEATKQDAAARKENAGEKKDAQ